MAAILVNPTDEFGDSYGAALDKANTLTRLIETTRQWREVADDAYQKALTMDEQDFKEWRHALASERHGKFMGMAMMDKYHALLMPEVLFKVTMMANQFHVPSGLMYNRLKEAGEIVLNTDGVAFFKQRQV